MRKFLFLCFLFISSFAINGFGQITINVDLTGSPNKDTTITSSRNGNACSGNNCVVFIVKLNAGSDFLSITPSQFAASDFYTVNCGPQTPIGTPVCINGLTTASIAFCKPGNNSIQYTITASTAVKASGDLTLRQLCTGTMSVTGLTAASTTWTSIYPGVAGAYNGYLSCPSGCTTTNVTPAIGAPVEIDYKVSGIITGCPGTRSDTVRVFTFPPMTVAINPATAAICNGVPVTLTASVSGGNPPYTYAWSSGQTTSSISTATAATYTVTVSDNTTGCGGIPKSITVTTNPTPTVTSASTGTICNSTAQNYAITSSVAGTTYSWSRAAVANISNGANGQTSSTITETLNNTSNAPVNVTYVITPTANGCSGPAFNYTVTVNPTPTVTSAASATTCNNIAQNYTITGNVTGTTYSWDRAFVAGISNGAVSGQTSNPITETLVNTSNAPVNVIYVITPTANGCTGPAFNRTVTVNPTPIVTSAASAGICNSSAQNYTITSNVTGATYSWGRAFVAGVSNGAVSGQTTSSITEILNNTSNAPVVVIYVITPTANGCTGPAFNYSVTVNPTPTVTSAASATTCNSIAQNYSITSNVAGATFTWNRAFVAGISNGALIGQTSNPITETLTNTSTAPVAVTYVITPTANGCTGPAFNYTVTVNPTPTVTSAASATTCNSTAQNYAITSNVTGTTYSWGRATVVGISNAAVSGQTSSTITETLNNTSNAPVAVTYVITPTANGCTGPAFNYVATVNPTPTVTSAASASICNSTAQNYAITGNVTGTIYSWGRGTVAGISNGAVSGQTSSSITETLTNTSNAPVVVTYVITPTANGCNGPAFNYALTVNPTPVVTSAASAGIGNNTAQNYTITSNVAGTTYNWGRAAVTGISNAPVSGQTSNTITETLVNTSNAPVVVNYVITPTANGCTGPAFNYAVTVYPTPIITSAATGTICNSTAQNYLITANVAGTTYTWSRGTVAGISNAPVSGQTSSTITETLINTSNAPVPVTYVIIPSANGFAGPVFNYVLTVNPTPTVTSAASSSICNTTAQNYAITSNVSGTTFTWSRAAVAGITNTAASGQAANPITETLTNNSNAPVVVNYVIIPTANGCTGPAFNYAITVNPTPVVTSAASATICNNTAQNYSITSNVAGATFTWGRVAVAGISNAAVSGQTTSSITETLVNTSNAPVVATYVITPTANGCTGSVFNYAITVNPTAIITSAASATTCNNTTQNYTITSNVAGTTFSWGRAAVAGISNGAVSGQTTSSITETLVNTSNAPVVVTYIITPTANGCNGPAFNYAVTVNPTSVVTSAANATTCNSTAQNYSITSNVAGATFTWGRAAVAGISNPAVSGQTSNTITETLVNTSNAPVTVTYVITPAANGCTGPVFNRTVTVNPTPIVTSATSAITCNSTAQNYTITSNVAGTTYSWGRAAVAGISNGAVSGQTTSSVTETLVNTSNVAVVVTYLITPTANGCSGPVFNYDVTVNPTSTVTSAASATTCNNTPENYNITSNVTGTTFNWGRAAVAGISNAAVGGQTTSSITETLVNTSNLPVIVTYVITPTANGCTGPAFNYKVTVNPTPTVTSAASATTCNNVAQNYNITSNVAGATFTWGRAAITGISNPAVSVQTTSSITETLVNTSNVPVAVTYLITPAAYGCSGPVFNYTITVNPTPVVTSAATATTCNSTPQNYAITSNVAGAAFNWGRAAVAGISNGAVSGQTASSITETLVNTSNVPVVVTYIITPSANGCTGPAFTYSVTVNPTATVTSAASITVCNNTTQNYIITSNVTGTTFTWGRAAVAGISNPAVSGQTTSSITETLVNTSNLPVIVTYVITPTANGCTGPAFNYKVTVNPTPTVTSSPSATICNSTAQNYAITSNVAGATFTWGRAAVTGISNAAVSGQTTNSITETLTNTSNSPVVVTYVITPTANGCPGPSFNYTLTVNPTPVITSPASATTCNNIPQNYNITSNVAGVTFTWSRNAVAGISNAAIGGQTSASITETLVNTSNIPVAVTYVIIAQENGCNGPAFNYVITVNPTAIVTSAASGSICNSTAQNYAITSNVAVATFIWGRAAVPGISNSAVSGQTSNSITETLVNTTTAPITVTYLITPAAYGCTGPTFTYNVTVNPTPSITSAASAATCNSTAQNYSITSNVTGTTFTWGRASVAGISNPTVTGQTSSTITETLVNTSNAPVVVTYLITPIANGCTGPVFNYKVTVNPTPTVTSAASISICDNNPQNYIITSNVAGATFNWGRAAVAGISNPAVSGQTTASITETLINTTNAAILVTYVITPTAHGCTGPSFNYSVTVNPTPAAPTANGATICQGSTATLTATAPGGTYQWYDAASGGTLLFTGATFTTPALMNTTNYYVQAMSAAGCTGPRSVVTATVRPPVDPSFYYPSGTFCATAPDPTPTIANPSGGTFTSDAGLSINSVTGKIILSASTLGSHVITFVTNSICPYSSSVTITITNAPNATFSYSGPYCQFAPNPLPTFPAGASAGIFSAGSPSLILKNTNTGEIDLQNSLPGTYTVTNSINIPGCAFASFTNTVTINPTPTVTSAASATTCNSTQQNYIITSNVPGATFTWARVAVAGISNPAVSGQTSGTISETLVNTSILPVMVTYTISPQATGCIGTTFKYTVTVNPTPVVSSVVSTTTCDSTAQNYTITSNIAGATFTWGRAAVAGISNPAASGQTGNFINETLINTSTTPVNVTYVIVPQAYGCSGPAFNYTVTVNPTPIVTSAPSAAICNNSPQNYSITANVAGTTFTWSRNGVAGINNSAVSGQAGNSITETLINNSTGPVAVTYIITPQANGCDGPSFKYVITVSPTPAVTSATSTAICNNTAQNYIITSNVAGVTFAWGRAAVAGISNPSVSGQTSGTITETLVNTSNVPVTVTYAIVPLDGTCAGPTFNYTVTVNPTPVVTSAANTVTCNNTPENYAITSNVAGTTFTWGRATVPGISNAAVSGQTTNSITETLVNTSNAPIVVTYVITPTANGCTGPDFNYALTVNPTAVVTSPASATTCNNIPQNYTITSNVAGTTFIWSRAAVAGISNISVNGQTSNSITETLLNTSNAPVVVTYVITPGANGCTGTPFNYKVTVNPTPRVTSAASAVTCNNTGQNYAITSNVAGATFTWSRGTVAGISNASVSGQTTSSITETLVNTSNAPVVVTYVITPAANGCTGPDFNYSITVNPTPIVTSPASATTCNNVAQNYTITSNVTGTTFTWGRAAVNGIGNLAVTGQTSASITETLINTSNAPVVVIYVITPTANGCIGPSFNYAVTVNPTPLVTSAKSAAICNNTAQNYTITSNVAGVTFAWGRAAVAGISNPPVSGQTSSTITETLVNTSNSPVSVTYIITPTANGCNGPDFNYTVTVNPTPTVTSATSAVICNNTTQNYTITSNVAGTTYSWGRATVPGISNAAVIGQTTNLIAETLVNTSNAPVVVTYVITPTANGCTGPDFNYTVTVNPTAVVTSPASATTCNNIPQNYTITSNVAGTTFIWSRAAAAGISNIAVNGQTGNSITETLLNTSNAPVAVTYIIIPGANGCTGTPFNYIVTVNPTPRVTSAASAVTCNNTAQNYAITSNVAGATFTWGRAAVAGISNPAASGQTTSSITETLVNTSNAPVVVTYVITPAANGCNGPNFNYSITVNPTPIVTSPASATTCNNVAQNYLITSNVSGTTFTWGRVGVAGIKNPALSGQNTSSITETLVNTSNAAVAVTYVITPSANGCNGPAFNYVITVDPTPTVTSIANAALCNKTPQNYNITSNVAGATFTWSRAAVAGISNPPLSGQTTSTITDSLNNTSNAIVTVIYIIVPHTDGCDGPSFTYTVKVNPTVIITNNSLLQTVCSQSNSDPVTLTTNVTGANITWTASASPGITGFVANGTNIIPSQTLINSGTTAGTVTYKISPSYNNCTEIITTYTITVNPKPLVPVITSNSPVCSGSAIQLSTPAIPGASYSWTGPNGFASNLQNPQILNATTQFSGNYSLTITVNGCISDVSTVNVTVNQTPLAPILSSNAPACEGGPLNLTAGTIAGATYNWTGPNGFTSTLQNPVINNVTVSASGTYSATVTVNGCTGPTATIAVLVNPVPTAPVLTSNSPTCGGSTLTLSAKSIPGSNYQWTGPNGFTSTLQNITIPAAATSYSGIYTVVASVGNCPGPASTIAISVDEIPINPIASSNSPVCSGNPLQLDVTNYVGSVYKWTGPNGFTSNLRNPVIANSITANQGRYSVTVFSPGCIVTTTTFTDVIVNQTPASPLASNNSPVCVGQQLQLSASTINGATYQWTGPNGFSSNVQNPIIDNVSASTAGTYSVVAIVNACPSPAALTSVVINQPAIVNAGNNQTVCGNNSAVSLNGTVTGGSTTGIWSSSGTGTFTAGALSLKGTYIPSAADVAAGQVTLTLTATLTASCIPGSASINVTINPTPIVIAGPDQEVCSNVDVQLNGSVTFSGGGTWTSSGTGVFTPSNAALNATYIFSDADKKAGNVVLTLTSSGPGNCLPVSSKMNVKIIAAPVVEPLPDLYVLQNETAILQPSVTGTGLTYLWTQNLYLNDNTLRNPTFTGVQSISYTLTVTGTAGCVAQTKFVIKVLKPIVIPNTFTPNDDGINDTWVIKELDTYPNITVRIFDRYGQQLYFSNGYPQAWDGTYNGKKLPWGTYYYLIDLKNYNKKLSGWVAIIK
jgi:gliding motility-associated-like protein